jgi:hypothetical protein
MLYLIGCLKYVSAANTNERGATTKETKPETDSIRKKEFELVGI